MTASHPGDLQSIEQWYCDRISEKFMFWNHIIVSSKIIVEFPDSIFFVKSGHLSATGEILLGSFLKFDLGHTSLEYWEESNILFFQLMRRRKRRYLEGDWKMSLCSDRRRTWPLEIQIEMEMYNADIKRTNINIARIANAVQCHN